MPFVSRSGQGYDLSPDYAMSRLNLGVPEALGLMLDLEHAVSGPERMMGPVLKLRSGTGASELPSPPLGGHTDEVLGELGLSAEELAALRETRTIT